MAPPKRRSTSSNGTPVRGRTASGNGSHGKSIPKQTPTKRTPVRKGSKRGQPEERHTIDGDGTSASSKEGMILHWPDGPENRMRRANSDILPAELAEEARRMDAQRGPESRSIAETGPSQLRRKLTELQPDTLGAMPSIVTDSTGGMRPSDVTDDMEDAHSTASSSTTFTAHSSIADVLNSGAAATHLIAAGGVAAGMMRPSDLTDDMDMEINMDDPNAVQHARSALRRASLQTGMYSARGSTAIDAEIFRLELNHKNLNEKDLDKLILTRETDTIVRELDEKEQLDDESRKAYSEWQKRPWSQRMNPVGVRLWWRNKRSSRELLANERFLRAASYVEDAIRGREVNMDRTGYWPLRISRIRGHRAFERLVLLTTWMFLALIVFERPSARSTDSEFSYSDISRGGLLAAEIILLLFFFFVFVIDLFCHGVRFVLADGWNRFHLAVLAAMAVDVLLWASDSDALRFSRPLRAFLLVYESRRTRRLLTFLLRTGRKSADVFALIFVVIFGFAGMGFRFFHGYKEALAASNPALAAVSDGQSGFANLYDGMLSLFVLLTSENFPEVMHPAYVQDKANVVFFVLFFFLALVLTAVIVAAMYHNYKVFHRARVVQDHVRERRALVAAFFIMDKERKGYIALETWREMVTILRPHVSELEVRLFFDTLDEDQDKRIDILDFFNCIDVLNIKFVRVNEEKRARRASSRERHAMLHRFLASAAFRRTSEVLVGAYCLALLALEYDFDEGNSFALNVVQTAFLGLMAIEVALQCYRHRQQGLKLRWVRLDAALVAVAAGAQIALFITGSATDDADPPTDVRIFWGIKALPVFRLLSTSRKLRSLCSALMQTRVVLWQTIMLLVVFSYFYAALGMELFSGEFSTTVTEYQYIDADFNSFGNAMLALFQLFTTSNWHEVMFEAMKSTSWVAAIYFVSFEIILVLVLLNLFIALIVDTFIIERVSKERKEDVILELQGHERGLMRQKSKHNFDATALNESAEPSADDPSAVERYKVKISKKKGHNRWSHRMVAKDPTVRKETLEADDIELQEIRDKLGVDEDLTQLKKKKETARLQRMASNMSQGAFTPEKGQADPR